MESLAGQYHERLKELEAKSTELAGDRYYALKRLIDLTRERIIALEIQEGEGANFSLINRLAATIETHLDNIALSV